MKLINRYIIVISVSLFFIIPSQGKTEPLRIGIHHFPPFQTYYNEKIDGIFVKRLGKILDSLNIEYKFEAFPAIRLYYYTAAGKIDLIMNTKDHPIYKDQTIVSREPINRITLNLYALKTTALPKTENDWVGNRFIIIRGYVYLGLVKELKKYNIPVMIANRHGQAVQLLLAKRADYLLDYDAPVRDFIKKNAPGKIHKKEIFAADVHIIIHKELNNAQRLMHQLEKAFKKYPYQNNKKKGRGH